MKKIFFTFVMVVLSLELLFAQESPRQLPNGTIIDYSDGLLRTFNYSLTYYKEYGDKTLYQSPFSDSPIGNLKHGDKVTFTQTLTSGARFYAHLCTDSLDGWIKLDMYDPFLDEVETGMIEVNGKVYTLISFSKRCAIGTRANLYSTPSGKDEDVILTIDPASEKVSFCYVEVEQITRGTDTLDCLGNIQENNWAYVDYNGQKGWMFGWYFYNDSGRRFYENPEKKIINIFTNFGGV